MNPLYVVAILAVELAGIGSWALGLFRHTIKRVRTAWESGNSATRDNGIMARVSFREGFGLIELSTDEQRTIADAERTYSKPNRWGVPGRLARRLDWSSQVRWRRLRQVCIPALLPPLLSLLAYGFVWEVRRPNAGFDGLPIPGDLRTRTMLIGALAGMAMAMMWLLVEYLYRRSIRTPPRVESWGKWLGRQLHEWAEMKNRYATKWPDWRWFG